MKYATALTGISLLSSVVMVSCDKVRKPVPLSHERKTSEELNSRCHCENKVGDSHSECRHHDHPSHHCHCAHDLHCHRKHGRHRGHHGNHNKCCHKNCSQKSCALWNHRHHCEKKHDLTQDGNHTGNVPSVRDTLPQDLPRVESALSDLEGGRESDNALGVKKNPPESIRADQNIPEGEVRVDEVPMETVTRNSEVLSEAEPEKSLTVNAAASRRLKAVDLLKCPFGNIVDDLEKLLQKLPWEVLPSCCNDGLLDRLREILPEDLANLLDKLFMHSHDERVQKVLSHSLADHLLNPRDHKDDSLIDHLLRGEPIQLPLLNDLFGDVDLKRDLNKLLEPVKHLLRCRRHDQRLVADKDPIHEPLHRVREERKNLIIERGNLEVREVRRGSHDRFEGELRLDENQHNEQARDKEAPSDLDLVYVPTGERIPTQSLAVIQAEDDSDAVVITAPLEDLKDDVEHEKHFAVMKLDDDKLPNTASEDSSTAHRKLGDKKDLSEKITNTARNSAALREAVVPETERRAVTPVTIASALTDTEEVTNIDLDFPAALQKPQVQLLTELRGRSSSAREGDALLRESSRSTRDGGSLSEELEDGILELDGSNRKDVVENPREFVQPQAGCRYCPHRQRSELTADAPPSNDDEVAWYPPYLAYPIGEKDGEYGVIAIRDLIWARPLVEILSQRNSRPGRPHFIYHRPREVVEEKEAEEGNTQQRTLVKDGNTEPAERRTGKLGAEKEIIEKHDLSRRSVWKPEQVLTMSHRVIGRVRPQKVLGHRQLRGLGRFSLADILNEIKLSDIKLPEISIPVIELNDLVECLDLEHLDVKNLLKCLSSSEFLDDIGFPFTL